MEIWLAANRQAHGFVRGQYWERNFEMVRQMLPQAEIYVALIEGEIQGFLGLEGDGIAGLFVRPGAQSRGLGRELLGYAKAAHGRLFLHVYRKNERAVRFYQREGFHTVAECMDENTGEPEYLMRWQK
ncbi:MAG: GNAT family N-acetyltransferase [Butyricicoccus sp.]